jgi:hypothetical protein
MNKYLVMMAVVGITLGLASASWAQDSTGSSSTGISGGHHHHHKEGNTSQGNK